MKKRLPGWLFPVFSSEPPGYKFGLPITPWIAPLNRFWNWLILVHADDPVRYALNRGFAYIMVVMISNALLLALAVIASNEAMGTKIVAFVGLPILITSWWLNRNGTGYGAMLYTIWTILGVSLALAPESITSPTAPIPLILVFSVLSATLFIRPWAGLWAVALQMGAIGFMLALAGVPGVAIQRFLMIGTLNLAAVAAFLITGALIFSRTLRSSIAANTTLQELNHRLMGERAKIERLVELMPNGLLLADATGIVNLANPAMLRLLGADQPEIIQGKELWSWIEPSQWDQCATHLHQAAIDTTYNAQFEIICLRLDGAPFPAEVDIGHFVWDEQPSAYLIVRDITSRHRLQEQLLQSQKLESIGRLAGGIAHDFNNLLTAIMGYAELTLEALPTDAPERENQKVVIATARSAANLTRQLLTFARRQPIEPRVFNPNTLLLDLNKLLRRLINENIELVIQPASDLGLIQADPGQIEQVIVNLVVNARDAMPEGGRLLIETANVMLDEAYGHTYIGLPAGSYIMLIVSDTGIGMDDSIKRHIFEPFFTTKEPGHGTGLGLATCYGIVKQHGGAIEVYSEQRYGTTFKIYLPRVEGVGETRVQIENIETVLPYGKETILVVEDEPGIRSLVIRILGNLGYTVLEAANGEEALQIVQSYTGAPIELLLTDVVMPKLGGKPLADRMAALYPNLKVLFTSGYTESSIMEHNQVDQDIAFLPKPFTSAALARKVRDLLDR